MSCKRLLTIQDISCVGQCSLTVALPIISACGIETSVLPSAVLSTHTAGFTDYTFKDLTDEMPKIRQHWEKEGIKFDAVYTGYLGSAKQIEYVKDIFSSVKKENGLTIVDPAMADNGKLYVGFDKDFAEAMKDLCKDADYIVPNLTEACLLTGVPYTPDYDEEYIKSIIEKLNALGCKNIIFTGVSYDKKSTGVLVSLDGSNKYYKHPLLPVVCHGTGDIYASAFVGSFMRGKNAYDAAKIAADYTFECIKATVGDESHWYGSKFEPLLGKLIKALED